MKIRKASLILATSALVSISAMTSFAGATGLGGVTPIYNNTGATSDNTTESNAGTAAENTKAAELINGFRAKLEASQNFGVTEKIHMDMTVSSGGENESMSTDSERFNVVNGENANITIKTTSYENGALTENDTSEQYYIKNGDSYKAYEVKNGAVVNSEVVQGMNLRENYFPIKYHGNETVTFENGEYVVKGFMLKDDYANSTTIGGEEVLSGLGMSDSVTQEMNDSLTNMPYELHFNEAGDLTYMQIDMSGLIKGVMSILTMFMGDEATDFNMTGTMVYSSQFNINPALTFVVPYYIN